MEDNLTFLARSILSERATTRPKQVGRFPQGRLPRLIDATARHRPVRPRVSPRVSPGVNPKIETRKLGTIFIEWEGTQIVRKEPCLYQGVQGGRGAADTRWRERERLAPGGPDQTQRAVPLARCVPQGWGSGIAAAGGPAAGSPESAAAGRQSGGGRCPAGGG